MRRLLISAAEPSGDRLAAELLAALQAGGPVQAKGIAGPAMRAAGVQAVAQLEDVAHMGLIEVLRHLRPIRKASWQMARAIAEAAPGTPVVLIDAPDLHLPLGREARRRGLPVVCYVSPQVWAWRPDRVAKIAAACDLLLCLFDFEPALYDTPAVHANNPHFRAVHVGHPLRERMPARAPVDPHLWGLLPGSRSQELQRLLPLFIDVAERLRASDPQARVRLASPRTLPLPAWIEQVPDVSALAGARGVLTKSGTVTLELAVMGVPQVVAHRVHPLTWWLGRLLVRGVHHVALPNILADRRAGRAVDPPPVPEHLQDLDPVAILADLQALPEHQPIDLGALGQGGASQQAADLVAAMWGTA